MTTHQIKLTTNDNQTVQFECSADEDIITAAKKQDIYLVAQCGSGSCGACIGQHQSGEYKLGEHSQDALPDADKANNKVLLCCTYPKQDLSVKLPYAYSAVQFEQKPQREATITAITYLTKDTVKLDLQLLPDADDNLSLDFEPGQFMELHIPKTVTEAEVKRAYSIANAPNWDGSLEFLIKIRQHGLFSSFLANIAKVGNTLKLDGASGTFMLQDKGLRPRYFVAGGCGLGSVMSMLRRMAEWDEPHPVKLFFGVWAEEDVFFEKEIAELAAAYPNLDYKICITDSKNETTEDKSRYVGSVVDAFSEAMNEAETTPDIYICGSANLIDAVSVVAKQHGINQDDLIFERYLANQQSEKPVKCDIFA